jgi:uncharacterized membrane protein
MTIGPLQIVLISIPDEQKTIPIAQELKAVRKQGVIRMVDFLYITRTMDGILQSKEFSDLKATEKADYGIILKGILGMRAAFTSEGDVDELTKALSLTENDFGLSGPDAKRIADQVPNGGSAMLALFEHTWAVNVKEAIINAGGSVLAQGLLSPEAVAVAGTTLEEAMASAKKIEADAQYEASEQLAAADQKLEATKAEAEAKIAEAQRVLDEAEAESARRLEQARVIAAANVAASARVAAGQLDEADKKVAQSQQEAEAEIARAAQIAQREVTAGQEEADQIVAEGIQTAEEIKTAAALQALSVLIEARMIKEDATRQAVALLESASMIKQVSAEEAVAGLLAGAYREARD